VVMLALMAAPLIRLALRAIHLLPPGEKGRARGSARDDTISVPLLPSWEKVAAKRPDEGGAELAIIQIRWTAS